tara:strand:+ start:16732 stop:17886 length:1155 start_codon:yes stop_codon:yes gene_type:complete
LFLLFILPFNASANFGLGPCCPPSVCGIIPCDSGCAGAAISQMGTSVSQTLSNLDSAYQDLSSKAQDTIDSMNDLTRDVNQELLQQNERLLSSLSAATNKIELANLASAKSLERNTDHTVKSLTSSLKEMEISRIASENNSFFGDLSQPVSGIVGVNKAKSVQKISVQTLQVAESSTKNFIKYISDEQQTFSGAGRGQHRMQSLSSLSKFDKLYPMLIESTMDDDVFQNIQTILALTVSKEPYVKSSLLLDEGYELARHRQIAMLGMVYHSLITPIASRMGTDEASWSDFYQDIKPNTQGKTGLTGLLQGEVLGKVSDPEWWGATLRLNESGLLRENVFQAALSLQLKDRLSSISESSSQLLAIILAEKVGNESERLNRVFEQL